MELRYLVVDNNQTKYSLKYKIYDDPQKCVDYCNNVLEWAKWGMVPMKVEDLKVGIGHVVMAGSSFNVEVVCVKVE